MAETRCYAYVQAHVARTVTDSRGAEAAGPDADRAGQTGRRAPGDHQRPRATLGPTAELGASRTHRAGAEGLGDRSHCTCPMTCQTPHAACLPVRGCLSSQACTSFAE